MSKDNHKLDILLINSSYFNQSYALNIPLGLCYMASILEKEDYKVKVLDLQVEKVDLINIIKNYRPSVVGISGTTQTRFESFKIAELVKSIDHSILIIYGGYHATAAAEDTLRHVDSIDIIVRGEGEWILRDIINQLKDNASVNLDKIYGISYRKNGIVCHNPPLRNENLLDELPYKIKHFIDHKRYRFYLPFKSEPATTIVASRGCIMNCIFCSVSSFSADKYYITRSAKNVCDEIEWIIDNYGIRHFFFCDNNISADRGFINSLCDEILARKLNILWECKIRVDAIDFAMLKRIHQAGCYIVDFGVESASKRVLKIINKNIDIEQVERLFAWCRKIGLLTKPFFVLGHPTETYKEAQETLNFIERYRRQISMFELYPCITIYPGTKIEAIALENGYLPKDFSWAHPYYCKENISLAHDPYTPIFIQPHLGFQELKMLYYSFLRKTIFKPRFFWEKIRRAKFKSQALKYFRVIKNIVFSY